IVMLYCLTLVWHMLDKRRRGLGGLLAHGILQHQALLLIMPTIGCDTSITVQDDSVQHIPCLCGLLCILFQGHKVVGEEGFRTQRRQMCRDGLTTFPHLMDNRGTLPTFHNE